MNVEAVILYSTNDSRFFETCINNLTQIGIKCHTITYSHMWNGTPEDEVVLNNSAMTFRDNQLYSQYMIDWTPGQSPWYWEGLGRYLGTTQVSDTTDYILYIDIDEIVESDKFKAWTQGSEYGVCDAYKLATYWYWRDPIYRSNNIEDSIVLLKTDIAKQLQIGYSGREHFFSAGTSRMRMVQSTNPMFHHFSWVRTKNEMLNKVRNWGHASDRVDWVEKVEEEFSRPFNGSSFVGTTNTYTVVDNLFNL